MQKALRFIFLSAILVFSSASHAGTLTIEDQGQLFSDVEERALAAQVDTLPVSCLILTSRRYSDRAIFIREVKQRLNDSTSLVIGFNSNMAARAIWVEGESVSGLSDQDSRRIAKVGDQLFHDGHPYESASAILAALAVATQTRPSSSARDTAAPAPVREGFPVTIVILFVVAALLGWFYIWRSKRNRATKARAEANARSPRVRESGIGTGLGNVPRMDVHSSPVPKRK